MKKNGFVFIESVVVLVVVALSLAMLISSYSLITRKTKEKEYYNKASDKYLLYSISNLGTNDNCNYSIECTVGGSTFKDSSRKITFRADLDGPFACNLSKLGKIVYKCDEVFRQMNIVHIYVVENIVNDLNDRSTDNTANKKGSIHFYDSGTLEYMKSLKKCNDLNYSPKNPTCNDPISYMIGVFEKENGELHYASIELEVPKRNGWALLNSTTPLINQHWVYYINSVPITGLQKLRLGSRGNVSMHYFYFDESGRMQIGWVYYDGAYHLFSPIDSDGNGDLDGRRIQSMTDSRIKVTVNGNKDFWLDNLGACYTRQTGNYPCTASDVSTPATTITKPSTYSCNGDECY